jgi:hypothetical protein
MAGTAVTATSTIPASADEATRSFLTLRVLLDGRVNLAVSVP